MNADINEFYRGLWSQKGWDSAPNKDEKDRLAAILECIRLAKKARVVTGANPRILDVGCGRGWLAEELKSEGHVLGIDPAPSSIEAASKLFPSNAYRCVSVDEFARSLSESERFEIVVCSEVLEHVTNGQKKGFLLALASLVKSSGVLVLTTPRGEVWGGWRKLKLPVQPVEEWLSERELETLVRSAELRVLRRGRAHVLPVPVCSAAYLHKYFLNRKYLRRIVPQFIMKSFEYRSRFYQVVLLEKCESA